MKKRAAGLFLVAAGIVGCTAQYDNPFQQSRGTVAVPPSADLLFLLSPEGSGELREIYALDIDSASPPTRLTTCTTATRACDFIDVAPAPDRQRVITRRRLDANGDGVIQASELQQVVVVDLARGIEGEVLSESKDVDSLQWTTGDVELLYSAIGLGGLDDLFAAVQDGTGINNFSQTMGTRERHPRIAAQFLTFERATPGSVSEIWGAYTGQVQLTQGDTSLTPVALPGTDYVVGSDADPEPSPNASEVVFRRLVGLGENGRGAWDILKVGTDAKLEVLAAGGFHGAPAWSVKGILFVEVPAGSTTASLIHIAPDGTRRTLLSGAPLTLQSPRWLP
jgi:hypothetical protein